MTVDKIRKLQKIRGTIYLMLKYPRHKQKVVLASLRDVPLYLRAGCPALESGGR